MQISFLELSEFLGGRIVSGDSAQRLTGFASIEDARPGDITFFALEGYRNQLKKTRASVILVAEGFEGEVPPEISLLAVADPSEAFSRLVGSYAHAPPVFLEGVHPTAFVDPSAQLHAGVSVGPNGVVGANARIGRGTIIGAGAVIGDRAEIGENCQIHANATVCWGCRLGNRVILHSSAVIGGDGFGYEFVDGKHKKVEQLGIVEIHDAVEIGAGSSIDRARFGRTIIGEGTKIDSQVQVGHNAVIGRHCIIVALTGIAGSARIGDHVTIGAQAGIAGHLQIADNVVLTARTGVTKDITEPGMYMGFPHQPAAAERRQLARMRQIGDLSARVKRLEKEREQDSSEEK